jgi:poly(3-hydroxyalkanoate) synthetase
MPAALHRDFIRVIMGGALAKGDAATMLGSPVDLSAVDADAYVLAGAADHLCPWQSCYRSAQLFGGDTRFVLSTSGHIAAMVNPPGNPKARFQAAAEPLDGLLGPADWLGTARTVTGSWWPDYSTWLAERSGGAKDAPDDLGAAGFTPLDPAPGRYVFDR